MPRGFVADAAPAVSVIMTALNESRHLAEAVASVFDQDYPGTLELVVAVGPSHDDTAELARRIAIGYDGRMQVVTNPTGRTPAGLNIAIAATDPATAVIVRTDGHAQLPKDYISVAVADLRSTGAANVGGMMVPAGRTAFECAVARAMSERIGLGSAPFHVGGEPGPAESVYLGVFLREILEATSGFDEHYARAQDWELNHRIRELGGLVWFDPRLRVGYRPRPNLGQLSRQFRGSGQWRWELIRRHPDTASARYLAAPLATLALVLATLVLVVDLAVVHSIALAIAAAIVPIGYLAVVLIGSALTRRGLDARASAWYPAALITMHVSWGTGFLTGAVKDGLTALAALTRGRRAAVLDRPRAER
jgi:succinoglycan biosynthesis protein ExoA